MRNDLRIAAAGLAALAVAMGVGRFAFTPILPMMQQDFGLSVAAGGWLASANYLGYLAGALWAGAARVSSSTAIRAGLAAIGLATLAMAMDAGFAAWVILRAVAGVASAWVLIHTSAWCLERLSSHGSPVLGGVVFAGVGAGIFAAGALCAALMSAHASAASAWATLGVASIAAAALLWRAFRDEARAAALAKAAQHWSAERVRLVIAYGAFGFGYIIPATFLPVMAREAIADPAVFGLAWPAFGAAAAGSTVLMAVASGRYGIRAVWLASQTAMAAGVAAPVAWPGIGGIVFAALVVGGTFMVVTMAGMQAARAAAGAEAAGLMAAMTAAFAAGQIVGPLSVSVVLSAGGGFSAALLVASAALVGGALLLLKR